MIDHERMLAWVYMGLLCLLSGVADTNRENPAFYHYYWSTSLAKAAGR